MNTGHASAAYGLKAQGVIAIYTKQGKRKNGKIEKKPGSITLSIPGFYTAREFYAPDYSLVDRNIMREDKRTTLYWKPKTTFNGFKKPEVTFYTSDKRGTLKIEIEGITETGVPFHTTALMEVE